MLIYGQPKVLEGRAHEIYGCVVRTCTLRWNGHDVTLIQLAAETRLFFGTRERTLTLVASEAILLTRGQRVRVLVERAQHAAHAARLDSWLHSASSLEPVYTYRLLTLETP